VNYLKNRHLLPTPRLKAGATLAKERLARAMIDVSDGLLQDLGHLCRASGTGAVIWREALPLSPAYRLLCGRNGHRRALGGGEDYELLFSIRPRDRTRLERVRSRLGVPVTHIGRCVPAGQGIRVTDVHGTRLPLSPLGYDHFKSHAGSRTRGKSRPHGGNAP
ncbi:MAG TPA: AIR synthase-related protein, partial [Candidatus Binatia bacterium]